MLLRPAVVGLSTASENATIRYTLDGSKPNSSSPAYSSPIVIASTTVVRARTFEAGKVPGKMATQTYFIDEPERPLPVVAFTVEPLTFFDDTLGIYKNIYKDREAPVSLEYFDSNRNLAFAVNAGAKIGGENIWRFAQKPLNIGMRGKYGDDLISYKIFPDEPEGTFDSIGFRNGGDNWPNAMLRDPMAPSIVRGQMDNDVAAYRPCVLYLNGEYWGIHNIRERHGDTYYFNRYHILAGDYDLLVKEHTINGTELVVKEGTADAYTEFEDLVTSTDLSVEANYEAIAAQVDIDSLIDYASMVDFVQETSWHHNQEFWRERKDGAKWRWTINDIDRGFNKSNVNQSLIDAMIAGGSGGHQIFRSMVENTGFKNRFVQRYAAHISSTFHPDRIAEIIDRLSGEVDPEIARHIARWKSEGGISSIESRQAELDEIKQFAIDRLNEVYSDTSRILGIPGDLSTLTVNITPAGAGVVSINGVPMLPQYSNTARLYSNIAFDLSAKAAPGFEFAGWSAGSNGSTISRTLTGDETLTATFRPSQESLIPATISADTTLTVAGSPYTTVGDVTVSAGSTLTIQAGVEIRMPKSASFYVNGAMQINGTEAEPVSFLARDASEPWGALAFVSASGASTLSHLVIRDATLASAEPVNLKAAVSNYYSTLVLSHADIDAPLPVFARGGSTTMQFCTIHPQFTGDGINIKVGKGLVEDCTFIGNDAVDTDAIDFDGVIDGVIRRNRIYSFLGSNSDAIDIGERCVNLLISENRIYNSSDKGVSVGQGSEVRIERNLIVGCNLGVGIKDEGSLAIIDQNTFAQNFIAVSVYEKNLDGGGGNAVITNTIFTRSKDQPVAVDSLSTLVVSYSMSDTLPLTGDGVVLADPLFNDPGAYDFSLAANSPAINAGDPAHAKDTDGSRADIGAYYTYDPDDYPFLAPNVVVINELLAHSHDQASDWIELYNSSNAPVDLRGWYLSDSKADLRKYRIADGTMIPANGYLVFYESETFGDGSADPNSSTPFALSENGETVYLYAPGDGLVLDYIEEEAFGPSPTDVSKGRYLKSSNTYNFVSMVTPTPGAANSAPLVGPLVISEIMYKPLTDGDAEYLELTNISTDPVTLYDELKNESWRFTNGIEFAFSTTDPVTLAAGERIILTRNESAFRGEYTVPDGTRIFQWAAGGLNNSGEQIELSSPGDVDANGVRQWFRIDRVNYEDSGLWPVDADGEGKSLTRLDEKSYGNDVVNWSAEDPTPGLPGPGIYTNAFDAWARTQNLPTGKAGFADDADGDGASNGIEFAFGMNPLRADAVPDPVFTAGESDVMIDYLIAPEAGDVAFTVQVSQSLEPGTWTAVTSEVLAADAQHSVLRAVWPTSDAKQSFFRVLVGSIH
ncbi:MAG: CotH kinase family protein [Verrucomicrobiales bacterium]